MSNQFVIPPWVRISGGRYDWLSNTAAFPSTFTGAIRSVDRLGDRVAVAFSSQNVSHDESAPTRSLLSALRARMRGQYARVWYTDSGYTPRGSFPAAELFSNSTFDNGTTGWSAQITTLTVADRTLRMRTSGTGQSAGVKATTNPTVEQYAPHVLRSFLYPRLSEAANFGVFISDGTATQNGYGQSNYSSAKLVPLATTVTCYAGVINDSTPVLGDHLDIPYTSLSRCVLIDNGQNLLLQSDEFDTSWTATRASVDDQSASVTAPDGSATADSIIEDATASNTHQVAQSVTVSSSAADYAFSVALKAGARTWAHIVLSHATGSATAWVNLSTGAIGTVSGGTDWSNARGFVTSLGDGWHVLTLVARKTSSATSISAIIRPTTADAVQSYSGDGTSNIYAWRATLAQASVPTRLVQTTTTAISSGTSQTGPGYWTKGWPASTDGLLLQDDWVQIGTQLNKVVAPVNSDASQRAYLQLAYPLRTAPSDGDAVIIHQPFGRFIAVENEGGYDFNPEGSNHEFQLVEDLSS